MRRAHLLAGLIPALILSLPQASYGQKPTPDPVTPKAVVRAPGGYQVPAGGAVLLVGEESVSDRDQALQWQVVRPPGTFIGTFDKGGREAVAGFFVTAPEVAQTYTIAVTACAVDPGSHRVRVDTAVVDVQAGSTPNPGPGPAPGPGPGPGPAPDPGPVVGAAWATAVFPSEVTPEMAPLFLGLEIRPAMRAAGLHYRVRLDESPEIDSKNLRPYVAGKVLPVLIIQGRPTVDGTAPVLSAAHFATEAEVIRLIGGK